MGIYNEDELDRLIAPRCTACGDTGVIIDYDDDGMDEDGAPIMRPVEFACDCTAVAA
jgi:hypothetical protein